MGSASKRLAEVALPYSSIASTLKHAVCPTTAALLQRDTDSSCAAPAPCGSKGPQTQACCCTFHRRRHGSASKTAKMGVPAPGMGTLLPLPELRWCSEAGIVQQLLRHIPPCTCHRRGQSPAQMIPMISPLRPTIPQALWQRVRW